MTGKGLWQKEWMEAIRTYKVLILPLVLAILGLGQPLSFHFMPEILKNAALPEGTVLEMPIPPPAEIVSSILGQYNSIGLLLIIIAAMGVVAKEVESGQTGFILSLGFSRWRYLLTKWAVLSLTVLAAVLVGVWFGAYYTEVLFGAVNWAEVTLAALLYGLYGVFILTVALAASTIFSNQLAAGGVALAVPMVFSILSSLVRGVASWLPSQMGQVANEVLLASSAKIWQGSIITALWIAVTLIFAHQVLVRKEV